MTKENWAMLSQVLMSASVVSVFLAGIGYMVQDVWLASTQWLLVSAVLALFGVYTRMAK
jgi:hypothetical protein